MNKKQDRRLQECTTKLVKPHIQLSLAQLIAYMSRCEQTIARELSNKYVSY